MKIFVYAKSTEDVNIFQSVLPILCRMSTNVFFSTESRRVFRELNRLKEQCTVDDVIVISRPASLGLNDADVANQLDWFIRKPVMLVICSVSSTYVFGVSQPLNKAVLETVKESIVSNNGRVIRISGSRKGNSGRSKIEFPDGWEELFEKWEKKELSSKDFLEQTGLKKATFYNLITEYRRLQELTEAFQGQYKAN